MKKRSTNPRMAMMMGRAMKRPALAANPAVAQPAINPMAAMASAPTMKKGGETMKSDMAQDKAMIKKAMKQHDAQEHKGGKGTKLALKKGGVAKTVTKEMEYDYKTGKKSFAGTTAQKDAHAEKEGKIVAKHLAYDKDKDGMKKGGMCGYASGGKVSQLAKANGIAKKGKSRGTLI